jgi:hypothetical protein
MTGRPCQQLRPASEIGSPKKVIRKCTLACLVLLILCWTAAAQRVEFFGGYQFTHLQSSYNANGWNASITGNFKHVLGITGDFSGAYRDNSSVYTYTIGPVLQARFPITQPFVHALFGKMTQTDGASISAFTMMIGGGIDVGFREGIATVSFRPTGSIQISTIKAKNATSAVQPELSSNSDPRLAPETSFVSKRYTSSAPFSSFTRRALTFRQHASRSIQKCYILLHVFVCTIMY